jgi:HlyD family secretion protein
MTHRGTLLIVLAGIAGASCAGNGDAGPPRATGYVEATDVRVAARIGGRVETVAATEGARIEAGAVVATLSTIDVDLLIDRARADRDQALAQLRLLEAGARAEDIAQAEAQVAAATAEQRAAEAELEAARTDEARFEQLLQNRAGARKQRDDAVARRELADARVRAAADRVTAARAAVARLRAGARPQELQAARARVAAVDAQIAALDRDRRETTIVAPSAGVVSARMVEPGEIVAPGTPVAIVIDLDHAWANVFVEEPLVPTLTLGQAATIVTDAGDSLPGRVTFISPRAEFTPRNVQTADERARLVYRVKVGTDNRQGILKPGMPVEVQFAPAAAAPGGSR